MLNELYQNICDQGQSDYPKKYVHERGFNSWYVYPKQNRFDKSKIIDCGIDS